MRILSKFVLGFFGVFLLLCCFSVASAQTPAKSPAKRSVLKAPGKRVVPPAKRVVGAKKAEAPTSRPATKPTSKPAKALTANELLVLAFWQAVVQRDYQTLFGSTGTPFVSDGKCKVFGTFELLEDYLRKQKLPKKISFGRPTTLSRDDKQPGYIQRSLDVLAPQRADCSEETINDLIVKSANYPVQFLSLTLTVGSQKVFTVMRLSKINGKWLVTGLKN